jgi:hypothetical protein
MESIVHIQKGLSFLISNFRRIVNIVFFLLGDSPASEFYVPKRRHKIQTPGYYPKEYSRDCCVSICGNDLRPLVFWLLSVQEVSLFALR